MDPEREHWYSTRCDDAITEQGLQPVMAALDAAGIPHTADQTGGFVMCVNIPLREGGTPYFYATANHDGDPFGALVDVCMYWDCGNSAHSEGVDVVYGLDVADLPGWVREYVAKPDADLVCAYQGEPWH